VDSDDEKPFPLTTEWFAPLRPAPERSALSRFAPWRSTRWSSPPERLASWKFVFLRFAPWRSGVV